MGSTQTTLESCILKPWVRKDARFRIRLHLRCYNSIAASQMQGETTASLHYKPVHLRLPLKLAFNNSITMSLYQEPVDVPRAWADFNSTGWKFTVGAILFTLVIAIALVIETKLRRGAHSSDLSNTLHPCSLWHQARRLCRRKPQCPALPFNSRDSSRRGRLGEVNSGLRAVPDGLQAPESARLGHENGRRQRPADPESTRIHIHGRLAASEAFNAGSGTCQRLEPAERGRLEYPPPPYQSREVERLSTVYTRETLRW